MRSRRKEAKAELDRAVDELYELAQLSTPDERHDEIIRMRNDIEYCAGMLSIAVMADCEEMQFPAKGGAR